MCSDNLYSHRLCDSYGTMWPMHSHRKCHRSVGWRPFVNQTLWVGEERLFDAGLGTQSIYSAVWSCRTELQQEQQRQLVAPLVSDSHDALHVVILS